MRIVNRLFVLMFFWMASSALAADIGCTGTIAYVMADHVICKDATGKKQFAFKLSGSSNWICSNSDSASSLVISAKVMKAEVSVYLNDANNATCQSHINYIKPSYLIMM
ncbi:hypothetical protein LZP73_13275 [Shewanella sp. AS16]|uniref:hypothetical protein n=1 Tax=Shewanella sp. AS16 TaxID=2907625 RepID=UPI001F2E15EB|nr:hypothetical protein [Shewanella sp. AS16]MCE9687164.1 hypothetical protein [Shewanella sp. AS16]